MAGIAVIRMPNDGDEDASESAIRNLLSLSDQVFDERVTFERKFDDMDGVTVRNVEKRESGNPLDSILSHFLFQIHLSLALLRERHRIDVTLWHSGGFSLLLPMALSRMLGHDVFVCVLGRVVDGYLNDDYWEKEGVGIGQKAVKYTFATLVGTLQTFSFALSTRIVVFSEHITDYFTLSWFDHKIRQVRFNYEEVPSTNPIESRTYPIVYLGRICELKGADRVANAIPRLEDAGVLDEPALFVGDGNMRSELEAQLEDHNVEFTGWLSRQEALELVADSKLFVLPSRSEGLPKALLEAMARGTVPVVSSVGDIPDVVSDGTNGVLLEDSSPEPLSEELIRVLESDTTELSNEAVRTIGERFSYSNSKQQFERLVADVGITHDYD